jgi:hypothetical protein
VPLVPTLALLAPLLLAAPATPAADATARCPADDAPALVLGRGRGEPDITAFLDPADADALRTFVSLRDLSRERPDLRIVIRFAEPPEHGDPLPATVRAWALAAARRGKLEAALRIVAADGPLWVAARIGTPGGRKRLAERLPIADDAIDPACASRHVDAASAEIGARFQLFNNPVYRLPVFVVGDTVFDDPPGAARLRAELGRAGQHARDRIDPPEAVPIPTLKATSARMKRPDLGGILLGGTGLPHRFVLMARDEDDPNLFMMLPTLLEYRAEHPGRLAVHVVARGASVGGMRLRQRLCAARTLGLQRAYVEVLATPPDEDGFRRVDEVKLLARLDEVPEKTCEAEVDPAELDLPDGAWLDGLPRTRAELGSLPSTMRLLEAALRPLSPLLRAAADG